VLPLRRRSARAASREEATTPLAMDFDFGAYVDRCKAGVVGDRTGDLYAFSGDLKVLKTMRQLKPVELAVSSLVRLSKGVLSGDLLGSAIKVGPNQYPRVYNIARGCAETLGIPMPTVYVQGRIDSVNAYTHGTDRESVIVLHSVTLDYLTDEELRFVIGHECGHVHNGHVVYLTTLRMLTMMAEAFMGWFVQPAVMALQGWSRAAEITCDRAGLLCCKDLTVAQHSFLKLVAGSKKLYEELNVEQYLDQLREGREGIGRAAELTRSHPYIPKRIESLRLFAESELYHRAVGLPGGLPMTEVDKQVEEVVKVM
jgi:Zn-dependent protease with chaperone function